MRARRSKILLCATLLLLAAPAQGALQIISDASISERYLEERSGLVYFRFEHREWEMITDPHDPALSTLGDGAFHPMSAAQVEDALSMVSPFAGALSGRVLILPYPRRDYLKSSCEGDLILLSPGIQEVVPEHVHATTIHEIGHLFQRTYAPEGSAAWETYLDLRGLRDARYSETSVHRDRPREIFAEDFRFLFGSALATASGTIENPDLPLPSQVRGLREWMGELSGSLSSLRESALLNEAFPNPARRGQPTEITFSSSSLAPQASDGSSRAWVVDVSGRRVRELASSGSPSRFLWDGKTDASAEVSSGVYFVRWIDHPQTPAVQVHVLR